MSNSESSLPVNSARPSGSPGGRPDPGALSAVEERLSRYRAFRTIARHWVDQLVRECPKSVVEEAIRRLNLRRNGVVCLLSPAAEPVLLDFILFQVREGGRNMVERALDAYATAGDAEERRVLTAMTQQRYALLLVERVREGGVIETKDVLREEPVTLVDEGLGQTGYPGIALASRVVPCSDFFVTAGAALPLDPPMLTLILGNLRPLLGRDFPSRMKRLTPARETDLVTLIIRRCLDLRADEHISFA